MAFDWGILFQQIMTSSVTTCFTILAGVLVFVLGQFALKLFVEPIQAQSNLLGEIATSLTYYADEFGYAGINERERVKEISNKFRQLASDLRASAWIIKLYSLWQLFGIVPRRKDVLNASSELIGLSIMIYHDQAGDKDYYKKFEARNNKIKSYLKFE